jgi:chaperonin GroES
MKVKPLQDRVLVERLQEEEKTKGGLFIPDSAKEKPMQGKIVAAGNGRITEDGKKLPMDVKVGDVVLFAKYSGNDVKIDDKEYLIMKEDDILAIVEK